METETATDKADMEESGHNTKTIAGNSYWTSCMAAKYLGVAKATLLKYVRMGKVTHLNFGGTAYYQQEWLDEYIEESKVIGLARREGK
jgi:hypothetical protein